MFWTYNTTSPQIDIILCKEDLTLLELLDQENVLQELKAQNLKLIEFLIKPEILRELVILITTEPSPDTDITEQYKYPNLACELLTADLPILNERLASEDNLDRLYHFLESDAPLNPLLSSYFSRTLSILISRKSEQNWFSYQYTCLQTLEFFKAKEEFIQLMLKHLGTSSIMDLMHNIVTLIEGPELKQSLWNWIQSQNVIPSLINLLSRQSSSGCKLNAASVLCSIIQKLRENVADLNDKSETDPILDILESVQVTELLLKTIFDGETDDVCDFSIEGGIDVLLTIMQPYLPGDAKCRQSLNYTVHDRMDSGLMLQSSCSNSKRNSTDSEETKNLQPNAPSEIIATILPYIKQMLDAIRKPVRNCPSWMTDGVKGGLPFRKSRLATAKLVNALISLNSSEINNEMKHCDIPQHLLNLFYSYSDNNFLHTEVEKLVAYSIDHLQNSVMEECNDNDLLISHLLNSCSLLHGILDQWMCNEKKEKLGESRSGFMGHLIRIATLIHIETQTNSAFPKLLSRNVLPKILDEWNIFVEETLKPIIEMHSSCLGGIRPKLCQSNDTTFEENISSKETKSDIRDFQTDDDQTVIFSNDPALFDDNDENYNKLGGDLTEEEESRQTEMFNMVCAQKWQSFTKGLDSWDDNEDEESDRKLTWLCKTKVTARQCWDSDDENAEEDTANTSDPWSKLGSVSNPWSNASGNSNNSGNDGANSSSDSNWAVFGDTFDEPTTINKSHSESHSTLATNADELDLFSQSSPAHKSEMSKEFSNLSATSESPEQADQFNHSRMMKKNWNAESGNRNAENSSDGSALSGGFPCFGDQGKDELDEMLNLESISGNTLAEKIANAQNDIRNKDEIRLREVQDKQQMMQNFGLENSLDEKNDEHAATGTELNAEFDTSADGKSNEQSASCFSQQDCLTENSVDFVTAENSTSDAESSVEFADAENSLEFEEEEEEEVQLEETDADVSTDPLAGRPNVVCDEAEPLSDVNVPTIGELNDECNNLQIKENASDVDHGEKDAESNIYTTVNGELPEPVKSKDCDNTKDSCYSCNSPRAELDKKVNSTVIEEPA